MSTLRTETRLKNGDLWNALSRRYGSDPRCKRGFVKLAAQEIGISVEALHRLLSLKTSPLNAKGQLKESAQKVIDFFGDAYILPESLYALGLPHVIVGEYDGEEVLSLVEARRQRLLPAAISLDDSDGSLEANRAIVRESLAALPKREAEVLAARFGIDGEPQSLRTVAGKLGLSTERIRQIEAKAMRHLRRPSRIKKLREAARSIGIEGDRPVTREEWE